MSPRDLRSLYSPRAQHVGFTYALTRLAVRQVNPAARAWRGDSPSTLTGLCAGAVRTAIFNKEPTYG